VGPADGRERALGFDTHVVIRIHPEGRWAVPRNYVYAGDGCDMTAARLVYTQGWQERPIAWPAGAPGVAAGFNSGGRWDSYFWVLMPQGAVPPHLGRLTLRAQMQWYACFNVHHRGGAVSTSFVTSKPQPFTYVVRRGGGVGSAAPG
jgi:hypothetical protein